MNVQGKIKVLKDAETFGTFTKRLVVVTTDEKYPQDIPVEFHNDNTKLLDQYNVGDVVDIAINLRGKEWTSPQGEVRYFGSNVGWKIEGEPIKSSPKVEENKVEEFDDLPF